MIKLKNYLALLLVVLSTFINAQVPTLIASAKYSAIGAGATGVPSINFNVPNGKNRVMLITTITERYLSPSNSNWPMDPDGTIDPMTEIDIKVNSLNTTYLSGNYYFQYTNDLNSLCSYTFHNSDRYITEGNGLTTGNVTISFPGLNLPESVADEMSVIISVYENVKSITRIAYTGSRGPTGRTVSSTSTTTPAAPIGRAVGDILYVSGGASSQSTPLSISTGWISTAATMNNVIVNNLGTVAGVLSPNEHDGVSQILGYRYGSNTAPTVFYTRTLTGEIARGTAHIFALFPLSKPSVSGTVYRDNNALSGGINGGGTGGGVWTTANSLYVNAINANGNVIASALVNTSGVFSFPTGGNLIEGDVIKFQLSKIQGTVGQPAPIKELPVGWGTVGESTTSGTSDGNPNGEFTLTIGTENSSNDTTYRFGVITCAAGATAPSVQNISNICPATTVNLNTAHTGIVPAGSSLVWFTNNAHTGSALSGTQVTQAGEGTYYAFYYDAINNCYSPVSNMVTVNIITYKDSDGDGIPDACDLDDDNDGILDTDECNSSNKIANSIFPTSGSTINNWVTTGSFALNGRGLQFDADNAVATIKQNITGVFSGNMVNLNNLRWLTTDNSANTGRLITELLYNGIVYATIDTGVGVQGSIPSVVANNGASVNINVLPTVASTGTFSTPSNIIVSLPVSAPISGELQIRFTSGSSNADDISIESIELYSCSDTDGDGIPNHLDLDSDGDGCPDAIEGTRNYIDEDLVTASGILTTQSPNKNMGTMSNGNGVPIMVGNNPQGIGDSQNDLINDCLDSDGDGISDWEDLDNDNDGITDCNENGLNGTIDNVFKANNNATVVATPSSGPVHQFRLTNGLSQNGQIWSNGKIDFTKSFSLSMKALLSGADGIAIVFHNSPNNQLASGTNGQGLGARGITNGIALELDTFPNSCTNDANNGANCDPSYDHGGIRTTAEWINSGKLAGDKQLGDGTIDDGFWHDVVINWNSKARILSYTFDGVNISSYTFPTSGSNAIETILNGTKAYFGFTASTGNAGSNNSVGFDSLCALPLTLDTDGDGIPNHLDLDSDGDGCPDAIEGTRNYIDEDLVTASGILTTQSPNKNMGTMSNGNGVPIMVGNNPQGIGESQNEMVNDCISFVCSPDPYAAQQTWWLPFQTDKTRIDFQTGSAALNNPATGFLGQGRSDGIEGSTSVTHPITGALLFVTDGNKVYKASTGIAATGSVGGNASAGEAAAVIPDPQGVKGRDFIIFGNATADTAGTLVSAKYNLEANTLTDISTLLPANSIYEALEVIPHTNGTDYWILVNTADQNVKSYLYSEVSGFNSTPVSSISVPNLAGVLAANIAGNSFITWDPRLQSKVLIARHNKMGMANFNPSTGALGVWDVKVAVSTGVPDTDKRLAYSVALSPNGKYIYYKNGVALIYYDNTTGVSTQAGTLSSIYGLKVAKDGRLYISAFPTDYALYYLADANNPVASTAAPASFSTGGRRVAYQLPNNVYWGCITCQSGTTAPALTSTTIASSPATVADLIAQLSASNQPAGTIITIHSATPATNTNKLANTTVIMGGTTYYASFFDGLALCYSPTTAVTVGLPYCFKPAITNGNTYPSQHGITALGRAGTDNGNWPMVRQSAWTVLEAKTKGLVINRIPTTAALTAIANPIEGMIVYDEEVDCLKIYSSTDGISFSWKCFITPACPD